MNHRIGARPILKLGANPCVIWIAHGKASSVSICQVWLLKIITFSCFVWRDIKNWEKVSLDSWREARTGTQHLVYINKCRGAHGHVLWRLTISAANERYPHIWNKPVADAWGHIRHPVLHGNRPHRATLDFRWRSDIST